MQPKSRRPAGSRSVTPEQIEAAVVERFLTTGGTIAEIALEFGISEASVRASIRRAAETTLNRRSRPSSAAVRPLLAPPTGWFDPPPAANDADARVDEAVGAEDPLEAEEPLAAVEPAEAEPAPAGQGEADVAPPTQVLEWAMRSVANGTPVESVANWFGVPESELRAWINDPADEAPTYQAPADEAPAAEAPAAEAPAGEAPAADGQADVATRADVAAPDPALVEVPEPRSRFRNQPWSRFRIRPR
jgi:transposase-like protein